MPVQVNLLAKDLPAEFAKCLKTTVLPLKNTGSCSIVVVGITTHTATQLVENTKTVVNKLEKKYPGEWINIRSIHLNSGSTSLPLYVSFRSKAEVGLVRGGKKPNRSVVVDELSTVVGGTVVITPHGNVKVKRKAHPEWTDFLYEQEISRNPSTNPFMTALETFKEDLGIETTAKVIMENTDLKDHDTQGAY